jgi:hypothetical protein
LTDTGKGKDRDKTGYPGTGRKKITPQKAGNPKVESDKTENPNERKP